MIARSFKSVIWVATVGGAALCCYMVSLRVATERADLAKVERQIIAAKREIRSLQTELGTRGRMTQLEDWNANVLALSAPTSAQFVKDEVMLARLEQRQPTVEQRTAEIRMASAETGAAAPTAPAAPVAPAAQAPKVVSAVAHAPPPAPAPTLRQASFTPDAKSPLHEQAKAPKLASPKDAKAAKPERQASAEPKPEKQAKADKQAKAEPKPKKAPADKLAANAKPAKKPAPKSKAAPEKKLAAKAKPVRHPAQESDAD